MQIYPIAVVYEMELTVCDNRLGRRQIKQYSVAFAMSLRQRTGIDAEQHSRLSLSVHIIHGQFGIFTANLTGQRTAEYELRILRSVNHPALQHHPGSILLHGKENRIELQRVHTQSVNGGPSVDAPCRRTPKAKGEVIETYVFCFQEIADRIGLPRRQLHARRGQYLPQGGMVEASFLYLFRQNGYELVRLPQQLLQRAAGTELQIHIAGIHPQLNGIATRFRSQIERNGMFQRFGCDSQIIQVQFLYFHVQSAVHIFTVETKVGFGLHLQQFIIARQPYRSYRRFQPRIQVHTRQIPAGILQFVQFGFHKSRRLTGSHIHSPAFGGNMRSKCINRIFGQEMMKLQGIYGEVCMIDLGRQVVSGIQIQTAFALLHFEQGIALRPVEPETRYEIHTVGHNDRAVGSDPGKPGEEIKVLRLHLKVKPSATLQAIRKVPQLTAAAQ